MLNPIHRMPEILRAFGISRSQQYVHLKEGLCPPLVPVGKRARGLPENEIAAINAARVSGKTDDEIRALVAKLVAARKSAS